jgi:hypothetical protein
MTLNVKMEIINNILKAAGDAFSEARRLKENRDYCSALKCIEDALGLLSKKENVCEEFGIAIIFLEEERCFYQVLNYIEEGRNMMALQAWNDTVCKNRWLLEKGYAHEENVKARLEELYSIKDTIRLKPGLRDSLDRAVLKKDYRKAAEIKKELEKK